MNRFFTNFVLSLVLAIGAYIIFNHFLSPNPLIIAVYVFIACIILVLLSSQPSIKTKTTSSSSTSKVATLYVGNLPYKANEEAVKDFFGNYVPVQSVRLMKDKRTGKRKGYGFIEVMTGDVNELITKLNDIVFHDRTLKVRPAKEKIDGY